MAYDLSPEGDAAALKARRVGLRAFSEEISEIVARMPMPETYLEAERGARAVWVADRALVRMRVEMLGGEEEEETDDDGPLRHPPLDAASATSPASAREENLGSDPSGAAPTARAVPLPMKDGEEKEDESNGEDGRPHRHPSPEATSATSPANAGEDSWTMPYLMTSVRLRLRNYADRLMECAALLDKPTCYLDAERAQRYALAADRMLGQLYAPPKPAKGSGRAAFDEDNDYDDIEGLDDRPPHDDLGAWQNLLLNKLLGLKATRASQNGYWPNGAPFIQGEPEPEVSSPFNAMDYRGDPPDLSPAKDSEIHAKARVWYAETHERGWETYSEAEQAEVIARIEADWERGRLSLTSPPLRSGGGGIERSEMTEGAAVDGTPPPSAEGRPRSPPPPPLRRGGEESGPSIRVVESVFAPNRFGKRSCDCALSAPKCNGPCPVPP